MISSYRLFEVPVMKTAMYLLLKRRFNKADVHPALSLCVRKKLWAAAT
jgi:hypothetical protein